ncbi:helix-turn-helix transcriptional regulator, partial [Clostridioides difficile]
KQVRLAKDVGVSGAFLSNIEAGRKQPGPQTARALADALGVPLEAITYPAIRRTVAA